MEMHFIGNIYEGKESKKEIGFFRTRLFREKESRCKDIDIAKKKLHLNEIDIEDSK